MEDKDPSVIEQSIDNQILQNLISVDFWLALWIKLILAILIVLLLLFISKLITNFIKRKVVDNSLIEDDEYVTKMWTLISDIVFVILWTFSITAWLKIIWLDFGLLVWGLAMWIWFSFRDILWNLFAWIMILTTKEFKLWDIIEIEVSQSQKYFWRIEEITIRYTVMRTVDYRKVIMPNLALVMSPIRTYTSEDLVRMDTTFSVHYETDIEKCISIMVEAINKLEFVVSKENTTVLIDWFVDKWVNLTAMFFFNPNSKILYRRVISDVNKVVLKSFKDNDIEMSSVQKKATNTDDSWNVAKSSVSTTWVMWSRI